MAVAASTRGGSDASSRLSTFCGVGGWGWGWGWGWGVGLCAPPEPRPWPSLGRRERAGSRFHVTLLFACHSQEPGHARERRGEACFYSCFSQRPGLGREGPGRAGLGREGRGGAVWGGAWQGRAARFPSPSIRTKSNVPCTPLPGARY